MATPKKSHSSEPRTVTNQQLEEVRDIVRKVVARTVRREPWASEFSHDLESHAVMQTERQLRKEEIRNVSGFVGLVVRRRVIDIARRVQVEDRRLRLIGPIFTGTRLTPSSEVAEKEQEQLRDLMVRAACASLLDEEDLRLARNRLFLPEEIELAELGKLHGGKSAQAISNQLGRIFGVAGRPGAVDPAVKLVSKLQTRVAESFVAVLERFDDYNTVSDPIGAAIGHLEFIARLSTEHRQQAVLGVARLQWLRQHLPGNRSLADKVLRRLVDASCFYVMEERDARPDRGHPTGLRDDIQVLVQMQQVLRKFSSR